MRTGAASAASPRRGRLAIWMLVGGGIALFGAANAHLVYVAMSSQPECVPHARGGQDEAAAGYRAARSACAPR